MLDGESSSSHEAPTSATTSGKPAVRVDESSPATSTTNQASGVAWLARSAWRSATVLGSRSADAKPERIRSASSKPWSTSAKTRLIQRQVSGQSEVDEPERPEVIGPVSIELFERNAVEHVQRVGRNGADAKQLGDGAMDESHPRSIADAVRSRVHSARAASIPGSPAAAPLTQAPCGRSRPRTGTLAGLDSRVRACARHGNR